jgi:hypothetical protein
MAKILTGRHAEHVGDAVVEPGGEIPADADPELLARLEAEGKLADSEPPKKTKKGE